MIVKSLRFFILSTVILCQDILDHRNQIDQNLKNKLNPYYIGNECYENSNFPPELCDKRLSGFCSPHIPSCAVWQSGMFLLPSVASKSIASNCTDFQTGNFIHGKWITVRCPITWFEPEQLRLLSPTFISNILYLLNIKFHIFVILLILVILSYLMLSYLYQVQAREFKNESRDVWRQHNSSNLSTISILPTRIWEYGWALLPWRCNIQAQPYSWPTDCR